MNSVTHKRCSKCNLDKPKTEFAKRSKSKDGLRYRCFDCEKMYRVENKDRIQARRKLYYTSNKESILAKCKDYREKNAETKRKKDAEYRLKNKDKIKEYREKTETLIHKNGG